MICFGKRILCRNCAAVAPCLRRSGLLTLSLPTFVVALLLRHHGFALVSDREAVQDISRRSRSAPTDRVQIHLSRPRRASQIGAAAEVCDPLRGRKHGKDIDRRCATRPTANVCDPFRIKEMWVMTRSPDPTAKTIRMTRQETRPAKCAIKPATPNLGCNPA